ncbi:MAG: ABC transporter substrate-binding protein [Dorea formicigenerans]
MKKLYSLLLVLALTVSMAAGCGKTEKSTTNSDTKKEEEVKKEEEKIPETTYPLTIKDQIGNEVTIKEQPKRIVSGYYISSSTCLALGLKDKLVAVEEKIDQRPIYKYAAADIMDSVGNVGSAKAFDLEACLAAEPDLVILPKKAQDYAKTLTDMDIPTIVVSPESHDELVEMIKLIGEVTNSNDKATAMTDKYDEILDKINGMTKKLSDDKKPVVYMCGTNSYLTTAPKDMYQASLIATAGGKNAGDVLDGDSWVDVSYEQILDMNPDYIIIPTNNMANGQPDYTAEDVMADANLAEVTAVKNGDVYNMPAGYEAWDSPVPSGVLGMLWMTATLHPDLYSMDEFADDAADFYKTFYNFDIDKSSITK